jgi:rRNA-processing protein FCF1
MKQTLLDTNFILSCVRKKIDFFEEIELMGMEILIPEEVIEEICKIIGSHQKLHFQEDARLALKLLEKSKFKKIKLNTKNVDKGIIKFAKESPDIIVSTLDREIKARTKNSKLVIKGRKELEVI